MNDDSSNDPADLKETLDSVSQITRDFESLALQLETDTAMVATSSMEAQRSGRPIPENQQSAAVAPELQRVNQSLAREAALGKQLISDAASFGAALTNWAQYLENREFAEAITTQNPSQSRSQASDLLNPIQLHTDLLTALLQSNNYGIGFPGRLTGGVSFTGSAAIDYDGAPHAYAPTGSGLGHS